MRPGPAGWPPGRPGGSLARGAGGRNRKLGNDQRLRVTQAGSLNLEPVSRRISNRSCPRPGTSRQCRGHDDACQSVPVWARAATARLDSGCRSAAAAGGRRPLSRPPHPGPVPAAVSPTAGGRPWRPAAARRRSARLSRRRGGCSPGTGSRLRPARSQVTVTARPGRLRQAHQPCGTVVTGLALRLDQATVTVGRSPFSRRRRPARVRPTRRR